MDLFHLVHPNDMVRVMESVQPDTCVLDPCPPWLNHSLDLFDFNYHLVSNASFSGKVLKHLSGSYLQDVLDETDCLDPFPSCF